MKPLIKKVLATTLSLSLSLGVVFLNPTTALALGSTGLKSVGKNVVVAGKGTVGRWARRIPGWKKDLNRGSFLHFLRAQVKFTEDK